MGLKGLFKTINKKDKPAPNLTITPVSTVSPIKSIGSTRRVKSNVLQRMNDFESGGHIKKQYVQSDSPVEEGSPAPIAAPKKESLTDRVKRKVVDRARGEAVNIAKGVVTRDKANNKGESSKVGKAAGFFADLFGTD